MLPIFLISLALIVLGGGAWIAFRTLRRRRRVWFVGEAGSELVRLTERRALVLRELRDLEDAVLSGRILPTRAEVPRAELSSEALDLGAQIARLRKDRQELERELDALTKAAGIDSSRVIPSYAAEDHVGLHDPKHGEAPKQKKAVTTSSMLLACLVSIGAMAASQPLMAQLPGNHPPVPSAENAIRWPSPDSLPRDGVISVELRDRAGATYDFREAVIVVAFLPNDSIPFDELTQMEWTSGFDAILDPHRTPSEMELALHRSAKLEGFPLNVPDSGRVRVDKLPAHTRIVVAALFQDIWWPCRQEFVFDENFQVKSAIIDVHQVSTDMTLLQGDEWHVSAQPVPSVNKLRWLQIQMIDTITITNRSSTHAVVGREATRGGDWIRIPLTPPPGVAPSELTGGLMLETWTWYVGKPSDMPIKSDGHNFVAPYVPWSKGLKWGNTGMAGVGHGMSGNPHGGSHGEPIRGWPLPRALASQDNSHELNRDGLHEFLGGGQSYVKLIEDEGTSMVCLVINKPIPPNTQMVIRVSQRPGILYDAPSPIRVARYGMPVDFNQFRMLVRNDLEVLGGGPLSLKAVEGLNQPFGQGNVLYEAQPLEIGPTVPSGRKLAWDLIPTPTMSELLIKADANFRAEEELEASQLKAAESGPVLAKADVDSERSQAYWTLAGVFLVLTLIAAVWSIRGTYEKQMKALKSVPFSRREGLAELVELAKEYHTGRIDPAVYRDERNRILNRLAGSTASTEPSSERGGEQRG